MLQLCVFLIRAKTVSATEWSVGPFSSIYSWSNKPRGSLKSVWSLLFSQKASNEAIEIFHNIRITGIVEWVYKLCATHFKELVRPQGWSRFHFIFIYLFTFSPHCFLQQFWYSDVAMQILEGCFRLGKLLGTNVSKKTLYQKIWASWLCWQKCLPLETSLSVNLSKNVIPIFLKQ